MIQVFEILYQRTTDFALMHFSRFVDAEQRIMTEVYPAGYQIVSHYEKDFIERRDEILGHDVVEIAEINV